MLQQKIKKNVYTFKKFQQGNKYACNIYKNGMQIKYSNDGEFTLSFAVGLNCDPHNPLNNDFIQLQNLINLYENEKDSIEIKKYAMLIENFGISMTNTENCYVKSSYMGSIGKASISDIFELALNENAYINTYIKTLNTYTNDSFINSTCKLYLNKFYITKTMLQSIIKDFFYNLKTCNKIAYIQKYGNIKDFKTVQSFLNDIKKDINTKFKNIVIKYNNDKKDLINNYNNDIKKLDKRYNIYFINEKLKINLLNIKYIDKVKKIENLKNTCINSKLCKEMSMLKTHENKLYNLKRKFILELKNQKEKLLKQVAKNITDIFSKNLNTLSENIFNEYITKNKTVENSSELQFINKLLKLQQN